MTGYSTESSPCRRAITRITVITPYSAYPANSEGIRTRLSSVVTKPGCGPMRFAPVLINTCATALIKVEATTSRMDRRFCAAVAGIVVAGIKEKALLRIPKLSGPRPRESFSALLQKLGDQRGPAGLMARSQARAVVAVEIFVKQRIIAEIRIVLESLRAAEHRPAAAGVAQKQSRQAPRQLGCHIAEVHPPARAARELDLQILA